MGLPIDAMEVDVDVVLGTRHIRIGEFIRLKRGAAIILDPVQDDLVDIRANGRLIARGAVVVKGDTVAITVTNRLRGP
jgi:flagellar motor switch protein FliN/FliY